MKYLKVKNQAPVPVLKEFFSVGEGPGCDLDVGPNAATPSTLFSLREENGQHTLLPGDEKIRLDGNVIYGPTAVTDMSRIAWPRGEAVFLDLAGPVTAANASTASPEGMIGALSELLVDAESPSHLAGAISASLQKLCEFTGAEEASLLCESPERSEWTLVATVGEAETSQTLGQLKRDLVSHTLLDQALRTSEAVFVESIIGHPLAQQESILRAKIFSCACLPLTVAGSRPIGALFLSTHSPRRVLKRNTMPVAQAVATQGALLLAASRRSFAAPAPESTGGLGGLQFSEGTDHPMAKVAERLQKLAPHDLSVLIRGETGTGKEVVAREIHRMSPRAKGPFVAINCAAIPPSLLESLLFGHKKGAFTGATQDKDGKILQAKSGTLFLDEIGDLSADLQTKLLRVLQEREVEPVGGDKAVSVDIRVLSATHQNLETLVNENKFRKDLFYRLNGATLTLPTLHERGAAEIILLAKTFLTRLSADYHFSEAALMALTTHAWPGNVRELEQVVIRAAALATTKQIEVGDLELGATAPHDAQGEPLATSLKEEQSKLNADRAQKALEASGGNRVKAAKLLGVSERTFYRILASGKKPTK